MEDLIVTPVIAEQGKIHYMASSLVTAMIRGGVLILDEGNRMSEKSWASLAPLLDSEWRDAFPRERALYMQQGEIVLEWTIARDGSVGEPTVVRASGVPPFDRNVLEGFRRAARRFPPPPPNMPLPVRILAPVRFANPMME